MSPLTNLSNTGNLTVLRWEPCGETSGYWSEEGGQHIFWRRGQGTLCARLSPCGCSVLISSVVWYRVVIGAWTNGARNLKREAMKSIVNSMRNVWLHMKD